MPPGHGLFGSQGHGWQDLQRELLNIATHNLYIISEPHDFREEYFFCFSHCKSMGANDPRDVANLDPKGMIAVFLRVPLNIVSYKNTDLRLCDFREEKFFHVFPL